MRVIPTGTAITESVDLAYELYNCVFRLVPKGTEQEVEAEGRAMPKVYMRFEWLTGWRVSFLDGVAAP